MACDLCFHKSRTMKEVIVFSCYGKYEENKVKIFRYLVMMIMKNDGTMNCVTGRRL